MTIQQSLDIFVKNLKEEQKADNTIEAYVKDVNFFISNIEHLFGQKIKSVDDILKIYISDSFENMIKNEDYAHQTIRRKKYGWNSFIRAIDKFDLAISKKFKITKIGHKTDTAETRDVLPLIYFCEQKAQETEKIKKSSKNNNVKKLGKYILYLKQIVFLNIGHNEDLRASEYQNISFDDILIDKTIKIKDSKHNNYRLIPATEDTIAAVQNLYNAMKENNLDTKNIIFSNKKGIPLHISTFNKWLKSIIKEIERDSHSKESNITESTTSKTKFQAEIAQEICPNITTHSLRHICARNLLQESKNMVLVSKILGHQSLETTKIYLEPTQKDIRLELNQSNKKARESAEISHQSKLFLKKCLTESERAREYNKNMNFFSIIHIIEKKFYIFLVFP